MERNPLISFKEIQKLFKNKTILHDLNLDIYEKEIIGLLGKSGCGKSTLLKILIGFYKPDNGMIIYKSDNLIRHNEKIRKIAGYVSQENSFYEKLTVEENLKFFAKLYSVKRHNIKDRIDFLLGLVNLDNSRHTMASNISGGMKRRLEFAISLVHDPKILILDEPLTGLDITIRDQLWDVVKQIRTNGVTIIISTHLLNSAQENCDRVAILHNNKISSDFIITSEMRSKTHFDLEKKFIEVTSK
ncbi:MAG: ABC transporter ATP-binding protein [Candidatus Woesearchaeota archaeon]|jgi:ABC-2 type transport system ATP-binding protein|nr:ABC transporter ATP-binding protein [Candidatus Woesearchaeota archaeon]